MHLETREPFAGDIETQTELALKNVEAVLKEAGSDLSRVMQMTLRRDKAASSSRAAKPMSATRISSRSGSHRRTCNTI